jgi:hypothetical protein
MYFNFCVFKTLGAVMKNIIVLFLFIVPIVFGCTNSNDIDYDKYFDSLADLDAKSAIALANEWRFSAPKITSFVTTKEVVFEFPNGKKVIKTLPDSLVYIAIAPYINTTHTCETHYPSSCQGELTEMTFFLTTKDKGGNLLYEGEITTLKNGFFELWLPRGTDVQLSIKYGKLLGSETIPTFDGSRTCITTIKLE